MSVTRRRALTAFLPAALLLGLAFDARAAEKPPRNVTFVSTSDSHYREGIRYSPVWHDPQGALAFLKKDLADKVGESGRPVVLMSHCGVDTDWWVAADWKEFYDAAKAYSVVLYLYGHSGTGLREWAPDGETKKWQLINDGQTTSGFFVIQIAADRLRAAYRCKEGAKVTRNPDRTETHEWDGTWGWRFPLDRKLVKPLPL